MTRKNLQHITLKRQTENEKSLTQNTFLTAETINLKSTYTPEDLKRSHQILKQLGYTEEVVTEAVIDDLRKIVKSKSNKCIIL